MNAEIFIAFLVLGVVACTIIAVATQAALKEDD
jgi:hypothetical protein